MRRFWEFSPNTLDLLIQYGFDYSANMMDFDLPYRHVHKGVTTDLIEFPSSWIFDDALYFLFGMFPLSTKGITSAETVYEIWSAEFDGGIPVGKDSISPNRYPEINSVPELIDFVERVRSVTGKPTGIKMVIGSWGWLDELFEEINRRGIEHAPDFVTVDSGEGGTGAAPMSLIDCVGLPIQESLPMVADKLVEHGLRERIKVFASGKLITPADVAWALCVGADVVVSARGFMFALGCIQSMQCNKNTCPTGITTHNTRLQRGLDPRDKAVRVKSYAENIVREVCMLAHSCGVAEPRRLRRHHCRIVMADGRSVPLNDLYPEVQNRVSVPKAA